MTRYPYQDASLSSDSRAQDLLARLSLRQKAGLLFHTIITARPLDQNFAPLVLTRGGELLDAGILHFNLLGTFSTPREYAEFFNEAQRIALDREWGIPITFSTDPRHGFVENPGTATKAGIFSQWPESIGMVALRDPKRMEEQAKIIREEYLAAGFKMALSPQIDLATEYRWSRIVGGLGEDASLASEMVKAQLRGLQQDHSLSACVKHFPGGGPARNGLDPHFSWGAEQIYPGDNFEYHLEPFKAAIEARARFVMPSYGKPMGTKYEQVAMGFNKEILTDLLRDQLGFKGIVLADWGIISDLPNPDEVGDFATGRAWGVEHLSVPERLAKALNAGIDQFGGEHCVDGVVEAVRLGLVTESRIDESVQRILKEKFDLGLFESPFVDIDQVVAVVGREDFRSLGLQAQSDSLTMLKNDFIGGKPLLPLDPSCKVFVEGVKNPGAYGNCIINAHSADAIIIRLQTGYETVGTGLFASFFHHGSLEFSSAVLNRVEELSKLRHCIVVIKADRPPVLGRILDLASAIIIDYGASDAAVAQVIFGKSSPKGKLPFDLPSSMKAVEESRADVPFDTKDPSFRCGYGLGY